MVLHPLGPVFAPAAYVALTPTSALPRMVVDEGPLSLLANSTNNYTF